MRVTMEVQVGEIRDRAIRRHLAGSDEPSETLSHFNVHEVSEWSSASFRKRRASTRVPIGVCRRNSNRADASTTITRTRVLLG